MIRAYGSAAEPRVECSPPHRGFDDSGTVMRVDGVIASAPAGPGVARLRPSGNGWRLSDSKCQLLGTRDTDANPRIAGGRVVDPANGVNDEVRDLWIDGGQVIGVTGRGRGKSKPDHRCAGYVVMPGGVDVHSTSPVQGQRCAASARGAQVPRCDLAASRGIRSGNGGQRAQDASVTGYQYAGLGYTTAVGWRRSLRWVPDSQLSSETPLLDKLMLVLMGNHHAILDQVGRGDQEGPRQTVAWLLESAKGFGVKVVNPGGVEQWKQGGTRLAAWDDRVDHFGATRPRLLSAWPRGGRAGPSPPVHLHGMNLGVPGNWETTLEGMRAVDGHRVHGAHPVSQLRRLGRSEGRLRADGRHACRPRQHPRGTDGRRGTGPLR